MVWIILLIKIDALLKKIKLRLLMKALAIIARIARVFSCRFVAKIIRPISIHVKQNAEVSQFNTEENVKQFAIVLKKSTQFVESMEKPIIISATVNAIRLKSLIKENAKKLVIVLSFPTPFVVVMEETIHQLVKPDAME